MNLIQLEAVRHSFVKSVETLKGIDLQVPRGSIYGLLGENGAGKSTTLKLILGLLKKQQGEIYLFGEPIEKNRIAHLKRIGAFIENPSLYDNLTARENLLLHQWVYQCPRKNIDDVLELVALEHVGKKLVRHFSLGMKQRLGIAIAYLHYPELLILDEPTNGLDPNGIVEMRELILRINTTQGTTILISSHILSEIERIATHVGILHLGNIVFAGTLHELAVQKQKAKSLAVVTSANDRALALLTPRYTAVQNNDHLIIPFDDDTQVADMIQLLVRNEISIWQITTHKENLEDIFMNLIRKDQ